MFVQLVLTILRNFFATSAHMSIAVADKPSLSNLLDAAVFIVNFIIKFLSETFLSSKRYVFLFFYVFTGEHTSGLSHILAGLSTVFTAAPDRACQIDAPAL